MGTLAPGQRQPRRLPETAPSFAPRPPPARPAGSVRAAHTGSAGEAGAAPDPTRSPPGGCGWARAGRTFLRICCTGWGAHWGAAGVGRQCVRIKSRKGCQRGEGRPARRRGRAAAGLKRWGAGPGGRAWLADGGALGGRADGGLEAGMKRLAVLFPTLRELPTLAPKPKYPFSNPAIPPPKTKTGSDRFLNQNLASGKNKNKKQLSAN